MDRRVALHGRKFAHATLRLHVSLRSSARRAFARRRNRFRPRCGCSRHAVRRTFPGARTEPRDRLRSDCRGPADRRRNRAAHVDRFDAAASLCATVFAVRTPRRRSGPGVHGRNQVAQGGFDASCHASCERCRRHPVLRFCENGRSSWRPSIVPFSAPRGRRSTDCTQPPCERDRRSVRSRRAATRRAGSCYRKSAGNSHADVVDTLP